MELRPANFDTEDLHRAERRASCCGSTRTQGAEQARDAQPLTGSAPPSVSFIVKVILWPACGRGEPPQQQGKSDGDNDGNDNVDHHAWLLNCPPGSDGRLPVVAGHAREAHTPPR